MASEIKLHPKQRDPYAPVNKDELVENTLGTFNRKLAAQGLTITPDAIEPLISEIAEKAKITLYISPVAQNVVREALREGIISPVPKTKETILPQPLPETTSDPLNPNLTGKSSLPRRLRSAAKMLPLLSRVPGLSSLL